MPVVGTAGHVDHGKSTLVQVLTGRDPDRWEEEKQRGLTIDLGFAWTTLPSGLEVGFVDVPGHERFIKNMLAGVDAITVALFVVAADEGWMPQSEEHLAILDLLGVERGVIALTRSDRVDDDTLELATLEVDDRLGGTSLAGSPIIPTSSVTGRGLDDLTTVLDAALAESTIPDSGRPRMWVDRAFTVAGAGTVLTGTLVDGPLRLDEQVSVLPQQATGRVRSIQSHERSIDVAPPGNRTAINLAGIELHDVGRGAMLGRSEEWRPTTRFVADLIAVRGLGDPIRERGAFHLHVGSGSWEARLRLLETDALSDRGIVVLSTDNPIPLKWGDRFILREVGRQAVVGGGRVLDPRPARKVRATGLQQLLEPAGPDEASAALLTRRGAASPGELAADTGGGEVPDAITIGGTVFTAAFLSDLETRSLAAIDAFHEDHPLRAGIPKARLAEHLDVAPDVVDGLATHSDSIELIGAEVRRRGFGVALSAEDQARWDDARHTLDEAGFSPPRRRELGLTRELEHALIRRGDVVEVSGELLYLPATLDEIVAATRGIEYPFSVADFRDALGITRKHAVPLVEWLDRTGVTIREGDVRRLA